MRGTFNEPGESAWFAINDTESFKHLFLILQKLEFILLLCTQLWSEIYKIKNTNI